MQIVGRVVAGSDRPLDPGDVVPRAVLPTDTPIGSDRLESQSAVQANARVVRQRHAGEHNAETALGKPGEQRLVESTPAAGPSPATIEVDTHLARPLIRRARIVRAAIGVADDISVALEHEPGMRTAGGGDPLGHLRRRRWVTLERDDGVGDVRGVDRGAGGGVAIRRLPYRPLPAHGADGRADRSFGHLKSVATDEKVAPVTVSGNPALPAGFRHPHASEEARRIAEQGTILRAQVGSGVHGTAIGGQDDRDEMGICLEPPAYVTGIARVPAGIGAETATVEFEQYQRHTVWDQPGGLANRSAAGDLDVVIYSARKWARLALAGNPTVLLLLFVPDAEVVYRDEAGAELVAHADRFVSRLAADRFLGYLHSQRSAMTGQSGAHTNRPELVAQHGYDTKFAMHALRLGLQGVELLTTGRITLPVPPPDREYLRAIRRGEVPLEDVVGAIDDAEQRLTRLRESTAVPAEPDRAWVDGWLHRSYLAYWSRLGPG